jgi:peptide/nickel transport system permease protein
MFDWYSIARNRLVLVGAMLVIGVLVAGLLAPVISPYDPIKITPDALAPPSREHLFGTDDLGRDILSRMLYGARISPIVGLIAVAISAVAGVGMGLVSGYAGGAADNVIMRIVDVLLSFPGIVLAIGIVAILGPGLNHALLAVGIAGIPTFARVVRGSVLVEKEKEYVEAARLLGVRTPRLLLLHILPNVMAPVIVLSSLSVATAILAAAALSFVGLGAQLPTPEWGAMLSQGREYLSSQWWVATFPGIAIALTVLSVNLLGDGLRDVLDPRLRT